MMRILILGGPGSGKSTLTSELAAIGNIPAYDLDWDLFEEPTDEMRLATAQRMAGEPAWIAGGGYAPVLSSLLLACGVVVWLDVSWRTAAWRIVKRYLKASRAGKNPYPGFGRR